MKYYGQRIVLYLSLVGMEGCWLYAFILLAAAGTAGSAPSAPLLTALLPLSFVITMLLEQTGWHRILKLIAVWLCWAVATLLMVKLHLFPAVGWADISWLLAVPLSIAHVIYAFEPALLVLLASLVLWWMGRRAAQCKLDFARLLAEFQFGLILLVIAFLISSAAQVRLQGVIPLALVFFCFALTGISSAHARRDKSWFAAMLQGHWGWLLALSICAILIVGLAIGVFVSRDLLQVFVDGLKWLWGIVLWIIELLASLLPQTGGGAELPAPMPVPGGEDADNFRLFQISDEARTILNILMAVLWSVILALALWRISSQIYNWLARRTARMEEVEVEQLKGAFWADLVTMVKHFAAALTGLLSRVLRREKARELPGAAFVRSTYRQMTHWAASRGYPRTADQTPYEYLGMLSAALPEAGDELHLITMHYVQVRYGTANPTPADRDSVDQSWRRIRKYRLKRPHHYDTDKQEEHDNG